MKVQMVVTHIMTGKVWAGESAEATQADVDDAIAHIKILIGHATYLDVNNVILPGDFVRQNCIITFVIDQE